MRNPSAIHWLLASSLCCLCLSGWCSPLSAQTATWDSYFAQQVARIEAESAADLAAVTRENWEQTKAQWRNELFEMLGLDPQAARTDLQTTVTGSIHLDGLSIERLHYQASPGLYVAANLYLPAGEPPAAGWPAVLYVCGHALVTDGGRKLGNKTAYQHHGLWFARHGVACLTIDTVQLGELHGEHHGTYKLGRWDWVSRGYTPAGVEAWNAIRAVDLLASWPGIDAQRIGITGRSGGGAYSWYAAALDERIRVAVPVAGITDLRNHVLDGCVEGHCDCMYLVNYFGWDYPKLAALIAPRPLLLANSDSDGIFPLDGVMRTHVQLRQLYAALGASQNYGVIITPGPHKDTQELQVGAFRWLLKTLKGEEVIVDEAALKELEPQQLAVFEREAPADERVAAAGSWFVHSPAPVTDPPQAAAAFKEQWLPELERTALALPKTLRRATPEFTVTDLGMTAIETTNSDVGKLSLRLHQASWPDGLALTLLEIAPGNNGQAAPGSSEQQRDTVVHVGAIDAVTPTAEALTAFAKSPTAQSLVQADPTATHYFVQPRGAHWQQPELTVKQKNQLVRRFYLLGQMPEQLQLADVLMSLRYLARTAKQSAGSLPAVQLSGAGRGAALATLVGLLCQQSWTDDLPQVTTLRVHNYPTDPELAPALPGLLRVCNYASLLAAARGSLSVTISQDETFPTTRLVDSSSEPQQANGLKIVEVDQDSAQIWVRATRWSLPNLGDLPAVEFPANATSAKPNGKAKTGPILPQAGVEGLQYAVPGVVAEVRVGYRTNSTDWQYSPWLAVDVSTDYSALIPLEQLQPGRAYDLRAQARRPGAESISSTLTGSFRTLPATDSSSDFRLAIGTCQAFIDRDGPHGFDVYRTIAKRQTDAFIMAGDVVYYDQLARSLPLAYYHWQRTYSLPTLVEFQRHVPTYFLKDDHDTYVNDSWPGQRWPWTEDFTFEDGQRIFQQQTGLPTPAYRTLRIGQDLQVWMMEGRDYRSPNTAPDSPDKSIWGTAQKAWLEQTLAASTAKFKIIVSPTPIVGPDRDNKHDNHSNDVFQVEGQAVRQMLAAHDNTVVVCGDRHWQYHSIDPVSGLHEFSVGPVSDRHAGGWRKNDFRPDMHQFLRVAGGYLELELSGPAEKRQLKLRHLDPHGQEQHAHVLR